LMMLGVEVECTVSSKDFLTGVKRRKKSQDLGRR